MRIATLIVCMLVLATGALAEKPVYNDYPTPPAVDRQGGEDIASAVQVPMPFSGAGTTVGYADDTDEVCPYTGSTSPDVVYFFEACEDGVVDITLCVGSTYDTKLYVYENAYTPGAPYRCNDDFCPGFVSELSAASGDPVPVTAGNIYYVVVDGYAGDLGSYTIDMTGIVCDITPTENSTFSSAKALYR